MRAVRIVLLLMLVMTTSVFAQDLASFEKRTHTRVLDNGLTVIILERHDAPVFSYATVVNAGSAQEIPGITGLAHMFEHMAFKGSDRVGSTNWTAERAALAKVEELYAAYDRLNHATQRDEAKIEAARKAWQDAIAEADKYVASDEFSQVIDRAGGVGMNAFTASDITAYFFSMPSNRFELWAFMESERFRNPVQRQFYKERDVVFEERRMRIESSPFGRLTEQFLSAAFMAHPYGFGSGIGWPSDLHSFSASDADAFFHKYYVPANMVLAIAGDINPSEAWPVIDKYFGQLPKSPAPEELRVVEPPQNAERIVILREQSQPIYMEGYHRPATTHPDSAIYDVLAMLLSSGRTSRLYKALVRDQRIAAVAAGFNGNPGDKYPNLFTFYAVPTPGHSPDDMAAAIHKELEKIKTDEISPEDLQSVKTRVKAGLIRQLTGNGGLALQFATYQVIQGDWRELFREVERIDAVTAADVKRVANATFTDGNRTVAKLENAPKGAAQ
ncbi:MAG TPA: pitrilysin family protein [Thermoanaerobaculia bacterium]|jgi:predicted Zn-dependent peptidase